MWQRREPDGEGKELEMSLQNVCQAEMHKNLGKCDLFELEGREKAGNQVNKFIMCKEKM